MVDVKVYRHLARPLVIASVYGNASDPQDDVGLMSKTLDWAVSTREDVLLAGDWNLQDTDECLPRALRMGRFRTADEAW